MTETEYQTFTDNYSEIDFCKFSYDLNDEQGNKLVYNISIFRFELCELFVIFSANLQNDDYTLQTCWPKGTSFN